MNTYERNLGERLERSVKDFFLGEDTTVQLYEMFNEKATEH